MNKSTIFIGLLSGGLFAGLAGCTADSAFVRVPSYAEVRTKSAEKSGEDSIASARQDAEAAEAAALEAEKLSRKFPDQVLKAERSKTTAWSAARKQGVDAKFLEQGK